MQKFYFAGTMTIAVRTLENSTDVLNWVLGDHLGSTSTTANADGSLNSVIQYTAFGREASLERSAGREIRLTQGVTPTKYRYTGQLAQAELGLDYYVARWYDPMLGHFTQADSIIPEPGKSQSFDRYAYVTNNPLRYVDTTGHDAGCNGKDCSLIPYQWIGQIYSLSTSDADFVINLFQTKVLGDQSPTERTQTILNLTYTNRYQQFSGEYGDSGFKEELRDGNDQVGHFITAMKFGYEMGKYENPIEYSILSYIYLSPIIGHEMIGDEISNDGANTAVIQSYLGLSKTAHELFEEGTEESYKKIINILPRTGINRTGNSVADLKLSKTGIEFGELLRRGRFRNLDEVSRYLRRKIMPTVRYSVNKDNE